MNVPWFVWIKIYLANNRSKSFALEEKDFVAIGKKMKDESICFFEWKMIFGITLAEVESVELFKQYKN